VKPMAPSDRSDLRYGDLRSRRRCLIGFTVCSRHLPGQCVAGCRGRRGVEDGRAKAPGGGERPGRAAKIRDRKRALQSLVRPHPAELPRRRPVEKLDKDWTSALMARKP